MAAYCAWSDAMTSFRLVGSIVMFLLIILLLFHTRVSRFARSILLFGFLFFFSCFFLDSNHSMTGMQSCLNKFENTVLGDFLDANNIDVNCYESSYVFTIFVDFFMFIVFFLLFECWGMCPDLYNGKFKEINSTIDPHAQVLLLLLCDIMLYYVILYNIILYYIILSLLIYKHLTPNS